MKQVTGQLNLAHYGAFDLIFNQPVQTLSPTEVKECDDEPDLSKEN